VSRGLKIFLWTIMSLIIIVSLFFYVSLYGMPIKKNMVAKSVLKQLEEKYEEDVELVGAIYNFKDKNYGGVYEIGDIEFYAEEISDDEITDTYPNEIWKMELMEDFVDIYKETFPRGTRIDASYVHSTEHAVDGPDIPRYDQVDSWLFLDLTIDEAFDDDGHWEGIAEIAELVQEKSPKIGSTFLFVEEAEDKETYVTCPDLEEGAISSVSDAKNQCDSSVFTGEQRRD